MAESADSITSKHRNNETKQDNDFRLCHPAVGQLRNI